MSYFKLYSLPYELLSLVKRHKSLMCSSSGEVFFFVSDFLMHRGAGSRIGLFAQFKNQCYVSSEIWSWITCLQPCLFRLESLRRTQLR